MNLDITILNFVNNIRNETLNNFFIFITNFASIKFVIFLSIIMVLILILYKKWGYLLVFLFSSLVGNSFIYAIKNVVARQRQNIIPSMVNEATYSFPSGHGFIAISFYGLLLYLFLKFSNQKALKIIFTISTIILIIILGFSRIYLGAHFPSDVCAGYIFGFLWLMLTIKVIKIIEQK